MRPDFIPREAFRAWLKPKELNKHAMIDGILAASYAGRFERLGQPFQSRDGRFRLIDIVARARAHCHSVTPPPDGKFAVECLRAKADELRSIVADLEARRAILAAQVSQAEVVNALRGHAKSLTGATLLTEEEIVTQSESVADTCGVYFLIHRGVVVYVGQSVNVHARILQHRAQKEFDRFGFVACDESALDLLESIYIHVLRPPLNGEQAGTPCAPLSLDKILKIAVVK